MPWQITARLKAATWEPFWRSRCETLGIASTRRVCHHEDAEMAILVPTKSVMLQNEGGHAPVHGVIKICRVPNLGDSK